MSQQHLEVVERAGEVLSKYYGRVDTVESYLAMNIMVALFLYLDDLSRGLTPRDGLLGEVISNMGRLHEVTRREDPD